MSKNIFKGICEFNITIIGVNIFFDSYLIIDDVNSKINGIFEKSWNIYLGNKRRCKIIAADTYDNFNNDTIRSAFSYYQNKTADVFLNMQTLYIVSEFGEYSSAISQDSYLTLHPFNLNKQIKNELDILEMMDIDLSYLILFFIFSFLTLISILGLLKIKKINFTCRIDTFKKLFFSYLFELNKSKNILIISFIFILLSYLNVMTKNFLVNSIKSSKVVVDTDKLINSLDDIAKTEKFFCGLEEDEIWIFLGLLNSTIYRLISSKDTNSCFIRKKMNNEQRIALDKLHKNGFLFSDSVAVHFLINAFSKFYNSKYWISKSLFESILALYIRKDLNLNLKKEINYFCSLFMQFGMNRKFYELSHFIVRQLYGFHKGELHIFNSIEKYREANQELINLKFESFKKTFILLFGIQFILIFIFILLIIKQKIKKFLIDKK